MYSSPLLLPFMTSASSTPFLSSSVLLTHIPLHPIPLSSPLTLISFLLNVLFLISPEDWDSNDRSGLREYAIWESVFLSPGRLTIWCLRWWRCARKSLSQWSDRRWYLKSNSKTQEVSCSWALRGICRDWINYYHVASISINFYYTILLFFSLFYYSIFYSIVLFFIRNPILILLYFYSDIQFVS